MRDLEPNDAARDAQWIPHGKRPRLNRSDRLLLARCNKAVFGQKTRYFTLLVQVLFEAMVSIAYWGFHHQTYVCIAFHHKFL